MITASQLRDLIEYDPVTGEFMCLVGRYKAKAGDKPGSVSHGYRRIVVAGKRYYAHRLAWLYMTGEWPLQVDHINGIGTDNRWSNLRESTQSQNLCNKRRGRNNKSGVKGVCFYPPTQKWLVQCSNRYIGYYDTLEEAAAVYRNVARKLQGEFARLE